MTSASASAPAPARTVGDVLLEHGAITDHQLAEATARQRSTGQPLGQILVESGAISRLHLASALAEQWSDAPDLIARVSSKPAPPPEPILSGLLTEALAPGVDARLLGEVRIAVQTLAARIQAVELQSAGVGTTNERVAELRQMVTGLADWASGPELRIAELEAATSHLGESVEGLAARLDQLIAGFDSTVTEIEEHTGGVTQTVEELAARLDSCVSAVDHALLCEAVDRLAARRLVEPDAVAAIAVAAAGLEERLDDLARDTAALHAETGSLRADAGSLRADAGSLRDADERLAVRLDEMGRRLAALDAAEHVDPEGVADLGHRVDSLARRLDELVVPEGVGVELDALSELRSAVAALAARPAIDPEMAARVDGLALETRALAASDQTAAVKILEARVDAFPVPAVPPGASETVLAEILARVEALEATRSRAANGGAVEVARLTARIDELAARVDAAGAVGEASPPAVNDAPVGELDKLRVSVESLWMRMSEFQRSVATLLDQRGSGGKLEAIERRLETIESTRGGSGSAATAVGDLGEIARRIEDMEAASSVARETLLTSLERIASSIDWRLQRLERPVEAIAA